MGEMIGKAFKMAIAIFISASLLASMPGLYRQYMLSTCTVTTETVKAEVTNKNTYTYGKYNSSIAFDVTLKYEGFADIVDSKFLYGSTTIGKLQQVKMITYTRPDGRVYWKYSEQLEKY